MSSQLIAAAAFFALLGVAVASAEGTRSKTVLPPDGAAIRQIAKNGSSGTCRVQLVRNGAAGTANITRLQNANGSCLCTVTTGSAKDNGAAEAIVKSVLRSKKCDGAPPPSETPTAFAPASNLLPLVAVPVGAAGAAAAGGSSDSPG